MDNEVTQRTAECAISKFWPRICAFVIDLLFLGIIGFVLSLLFREALELIGVFGRLVGLLIFILYFGILNSKYSIGQTIGKNLMKIKVVGSDGEYISGRTSFLRASTLGIPYCINMWNSDNPIFLVILSIIFSVMVFGFIYFYVANRHTRQSLHDLLFRTYVVTSSDARFVPERQNKKVHLYVFLGISILISMSIVFLNVILANNVSLVDLKKINNEVLQNQTVQSSSVDLGRTFLSSGQMTYLHITVVPKNGVQFGKAESLGLLKTLYRKYDGKLGFDQFQVTVSHILNIAIYSENQSESYEFDKTQIQ